MKLLKKMILLTIIALCITPSAHAIILLQDDADNQLANAAYQNDNIAVQKLITQEGANVNSVRFDKTPLCAAAEEGSTDAAEALISNGANVNFQNRKNGMTPIMIAAQNGHDLIVEMLLNTGNVDLTLVDHSGNDALFYAQQGGNTKIISLIENAF